MGTEITRKQPSRKNATLSAERVLNSTSPIGKPEVDLLLFYITCIKDWDTLYSEDEKQNILSTLPYNYQKINRNTDGKITCPIPLDLVAADSFFRDGIARFQRDVSDGYWTATWRHNAAKASEDRANGKFDEYLQQCIDETFPGAGGEGNDGD